MDLEKPVEYNHVWFPTEERKRKTVPHAIQQPGFMYFGKSHKSNGNIILDGYRSELVVINLEEAVARKGLKSIGIPYDRALRQNYFEKLNFRKTRAMWKKIDGLHNLLKDDNYITQVWCELIMNHFKKENKKNKFVIPRKNINMEACIRIEEGLAKYFIDFLKNKRYERLEDYLEKHA